MTRWKILIEYDGRPFAGFQKQPDLSTVQGEIETALYKFCGQEIDLTVAGRTDAGVHARGQIAHFDLDYFYEDGRARDISGFDLMKAINAHLAKYPISILQAEPVSDDFHARFSAKQKHYIYRIINRPNKLSLDKGLVWWVKKPLVIDPMQDASLCLIGEHDFSTFRDSGCQAKSPIRSIDDVKIIPQICNAKYSHL